jgi:hypothetical protein
MSTALGKNVYGGREKKFAIGRSEEKPYFVTLGYPHKNSM